MRTDTELLAIVRDNTAYLLYDFGLCSVAYELWFCDVITSNERDCILFIICLYAPKRAESPYSWPQGEVAPRIEWLNMMLQRIKEGGNL